MALNELNPVELYEGAAQYMHGIISGVREDQHDGSTPCERWSVRELITHNIKVSQAYHGFLTSSEAVNAFDVGDPIPEEGAVAAFAASTGRLLEAIKEPGALDRMVESPFGSIPGGQLIMFPFADLLIHKWDLAKATDQDSTMDSSLVDVCFSILEPRMERLRSGGNFGRGVSVPVSASSQDKLLAITGRQP